MKLLRIRLRNYRGVTDREIEFARDGVTVVQGPNDIGKSSIAEAIDLLLDELDSTEKAAVRATKPVDRDVGPEVELDVETGPYEFTYRKRFLRRPETQLSIRSPGPESLTGRDAHARVLSILAETVDVPLWRALRIQQGQGLEQAAVVGATSLTAALDRAAGTAPAGIEEHALYDGVMAEFEEYFTPTGRPKGDLADLKSKVDDWRTRLEEVDAELAKLEEDVQASSRLRGELIQISQRQTEQVAKIDDYRESSLLISKLRDQLAAVEARRETARTSADQVRVTEATRQDEADALAERIADRERRVEAFSESDASYENAASRLAQAEAALDAARISRDEAQQSRQLRGDDANFRRDERELAALDQRKSRIDAALPSLREAEAVSAANRVDDETLAAVNEADLDVERARARLDAERPAVRIESLGDVDLEIDGVPRSLETGERHDSKIRELFRFVIPDIVAVEVEPGLGDARLDDALQTMLTRLRELCEQCGVTTAAEARAANDLRKRAEQTRATQRDVVDGNLGDLTTDELETGIAELKERVSAYRADRAADPPIAIDEALVRKDEEAAVRRLAEAQELLQRAEHERDAARVRRDDLHEAHNEDAVHIQLLKAEADRLAEALASAREAVTDEDLKLQREEADAHAALIDEETKQACERLDAEAPQSHEALFENAQEVLAGIADERRQVEDALLEVDTRLRDHGEDGLAEERGSAESERHAAERTLEQYSRRAAARKLLHDTMQAARDEAHRMYVAPLRGRIEQLGRIVFPEKGFAIQLNDNLQIVSRTLGNLTVPFDSIGGGAREQLGIITRLACAMSVAEDGGVPVILDDALGYSDPQRIEAMGAVLRAAGSDCQVIILTCDPDRYRHVGAKSVVRL